MIDQSIMDAFSMMWGKFPEPVMLVQKDRTILAVNALAQTAGIQTGIKCFTLIPKEHRVEHAVIASQTKPSARMRQSVKRWILAVQQSTATGSL